MEEKILIEFLGGPERLPRAMNLGEFPDVCRMMSEIHNDRIFLELIGYDDTTLLLIDDEYKNLIEAADLLGYEIAEVKHD